MFLLILFTLNLIHCAISDFPQCLQQVCQSPEDSIGKYALGFAKEIAHNLFLQSFYTGYQFDVST